MAIALVSVPCIAPGTLPAGIALLKAELSMMGETTKCFYLANEFELHLWDAHPHLSEFYEWASEVGCDYQNPYFGSLVFRNLDPDAAVRHAVNLLLTGRLKPRTISGSKLAIARREILYGIRFCRILRTFINHKARDILDAEPSVVGFSCLSSQLFVAVYMVGLIKQARPSVKTVIGGSAFTETSARFHACHLTHVDHVVVGRDVRRLAAAVRSIRAGQGTSKVITLPRASEASRWPFPDYSDAAPLLNHDRRPSLAVPLTNSATCDWGRCVFCPAERSPCQSRRWSPDAVGDFIAGMVSQYAAIAFDFAEWEISSHPESLRKLCEGLTKRGLRLRLWGEFAPSETSRPLFAAMAGCGRWSIQMGVESFSDELLRMMKKRQTVVDNIEAIRMAIEENIGDVTFNLIAGFPGSRAPHVRQTKVMIRRLAHMLSDARVSVQIVPYMRFRRECEDETGSRRETHYLPKALRRHFPTQLLYDERPSDESAPWRAVQREIESLEACEFVAFETGKRIIVEDSRTDVRAQSLRGLEADILRLLLDHKRTRMELSQLLRRNAAEVSAALKSIQMAGLVANSGHLYASIPTRG